jgi:hypothetical protein
MPKTDLLKLPDDFEGNLRALLQTPPAPHDTVGSRKAAPKPPPKPKKGFKKKRAKGTALADPFKTHGPKHAYEMASVLKGGKRAKKKAAKKR